MLKDIFSVENKVIIITGAGRGIGKTLSYALTDRLAVVYAVDIKFTDRVPAALTKRLFQKKCDLTNLDKFGEICSEIFTKHKRIDVLINNAGISYATKKITKYPLDIWNKTLAVNLTAAFNCSQSVIKFMSKKKNGSIINITSINAELGFPRNPAYVASKGGLKMLGKALAKDWGSYGIRVNNLGPGYIKTDMTYKRYLDKKTRKEREQRTLLGRWGEQEDLIGPCIFLASDASKYITGQDLYVDGGWLVNSGLT